MHSGFPPTPEEKKPSKKPSLTRAQKVADEAIVVQRLMRERAKRFEEKFPNHGYPEEYFNARQSYGNTSLAKKVADVYLGDKGADNGLEKVVVEHPETIELQRSFRELNRTLRNAYTGVLNGHPLEVQKIEEAFTKMDEALDAAKTELEKKKGADPASAKSIEDALKIIDKQQKDLQEIQEKTICEQMGKLKKQLEDQKQQDLILSTKTAMAMDLGYLQHQDLWVEVSDDYEAEVRERHDTELDDDADASLDEDAATVTQQQDDFDLYQHKHDMLTGARQGRFKRQGTDFEIYIDGNGVRPSNSHAHAEKNLLGIKPNWDDKNDKRWKKFDEGYKESIKISLMRGGKNSVGYSISEEHSKFSYNFDEMMRFIHLVEEMNRKELKRYEKSPDLKTPEKDKPTRLHAAFHQDEFIKKLLDPEADKRFRERFPISKEQRKLLQDQIDKVNKIERQIKREEKAYLIRIAPEHQKQKELIEEKSDTMSLDKKIKKIEEQKKDYDSKFASLDADKSAPEKGLKALEDRLKEVAAACVRLDSIDYAVAETRKVDIMSGEHKEKGLTGDKDKMTYREEKQGKVEPQKVEYTIDKVEKLQALLGREIKDIQDRMDAIKTKLNIEKAKPDDKKAPDDKSSPLVLSAAAEPKAEKIKAMETRLSALSDQAEKLQAELTKHNDRYKDRKSGKLDEKDLHTPQQGEAVRRR